MFGWLKPKPRQRTDSEYEQEFLRLVRGVEAQFSIGQSDREQLLSAMGAIEREMNGHGGCNWASHHEDYLDTINHYLNDERQFDPPVREKIQWCLEEIYECGRELVDAGESSRNATEAVTYLTQRTVDWCERNSVKSDSGSSL